MADDPSAVRIPAGAVQIPGAGWQYVLDSDYRRDSAEHFARLTGRTRRYGRSGWAFVLDAVPADALLDLFEYMESAAGAQEAALGDQRGDPEMYASVRKDAEGLRRGADRIAIALAMVGVEAVTFDERCRRERAARQEAAK